MAERKICWRVTRYCNLHCLHCLAGYGNAVRRDLSRDERSVAIGNIFDSEVTRITWTGGEPTLCNDLPDLIARCHSHSVRSVITTHGLSLKPRFLEGLRSELDTIRISFDGLQQTHDAVRGAPCFTKALSSIGLCERYGVKVEANITLLPQSYDELPDLVATLVRERVSRIVFLTLLARESAVDNGLAALSACQRASLTQIIGTLAKRYPTVGLQMNDYADVDDSYVVVEADGDVLLCNERGDDQTYGNVCDQSGSANLRRAMSAQTLSHRGLSV